MVAPLSDIVKVQITVQSGGGGQTLNLVPLILDHQNVLGTLMYTGLLTGVITPVIQEYSSVAEMLADGFKPWHYAVKLAKTIFAQDKHPNSIKVAGWNSGHNIGDTLTAIEMADPNWFTLLLTLRSSASDTEMKVNDAADWCLSTAEQRHVLVFEETQAEAKSTAANLFSILHGDENDRAMGVYNPSRPQYKKLTFSRDLIANNSVNMQVNGVNIGSTVYAVSHASTMAVIATALKGVSNGAISAASVLASGYDIIVKASDPMVDLTFNTVVLADGVSPAITGGASQPTIAVSDCDVQVLRLTFSAALVALNQVDITVSGHPILPVVYAGDSDTTLAAVATALAALPGVGFADVIEVSAGVDNDRVIEVAAWDSSTILRVTSAAVTLGVSQPPITIEKVSTTGVEPDDGCWVGRCASAEPGTLDWANKKLKLAEPAELTTSERSAILNNNGNFYANFGGYKATRLGRMASGLTMQNRVLVDALHIEIQTAVADALTTPDFVPYMDTGIATIGAAVEGPLQKYKVRGALASYTLSLPARVDVAPADVTAGLLRNVKFNAISAGTIQTVEIEGTLQV